MENSYTRWVELQQEEKQQKESEREIQVGVQTIVDRVYPQIVNELGIKNKMVPMVELHRDIYERLSGIEGMEGEESKSTKAEYDNTENKIFIYYPNMVNEEDVIRSLLHEYTHSLQDRTNRKEHRALGYDNDPDEIEALKAELNWREYLQNNLTDAKESYMIRKIMTNSDGKKSHVILTNGYSEVLERKNKTLMIKLIQLLNENTTKECGIYELITIQNYPSCVTQ